MASDVKGKYTLRTRSSENNYEAVSTNYDSEIDYSFSEEDDEPIADLDYAQNASFDEDQPQQGHFDDNNNDAVVIQHDDNPLPAQIPARNDEKKGIPHNWDSKKWKDGDTNFCWTPGFNENSGFLIDIPDTADELYFLSLFLTDDVLADIVLQTNKYIKGRNFGGNLIWQMAEKVFSYGIKFGRWLRNLNLAGI